MGFFSEIASEARRGMAGSQAQTAARQTAVTPPAAPDSAPVPPVAVPAVQPGPAPEAAVPVPAEATQKPIPAPEPPAINLTPERSEERRVGKEC